MVKSSLLYVIHNRSYSPLKNVPEWEHCRFWVNQETKLVITKRLYFSQKQLPRKSIVECAGYIFWMLLLRGLYFLDVAFARAIFSGCCFCGEHLNNDMIYYKTTSVMLTLRGINKKLFTIN